MFTITCSVITCLCMVNWVKAGHRSDFPSIQPIHLDVQDCPSCHSCLSSSPHQRMAVRRDAFTERTGRGKDNLSYRMTISHPFSRNGGHFHSLTFNLPQFSWLLKAATTNFSEKSHYFDITPTCSKKSLPDILAHSLTQYVLSKHHRNSKMTYF